MEAKHLPIAFDRETDGLSRLVTWRPADLGCCEIARPLTPAERAALERRAEALRGALEPFDRERPGDLDRAAEAAADMFGSFPSMREQGDDSVARVDGLLRSLARGGHPTWAIEEACRSIQDTGYVRADGKRERHWAPADAEVGAVAREHARMRADALRSAEAVLGAKVGR